MLNHLEHWQRDNVERKLNDAVREAMMYGVAAGDLKRLLAYCWEQELTDMARRGAEEIRATP